LQLIEVLDGTEMDLMDQTVFAQTEIKGLACDSRQVFPGFVFAALPGHKLDGRDYISNALKQGAVCVLAPLGTTLPEDAFNFSTGKSVSLLRHANPRRQYALMASSFYKAQPNLICAITGTNGKTSVVSFLRQIWTGLGYNAASVGTLGIVSGGIESRGTMTTPDSVDLHRTLQDLSYSGVSHLALEASSHGLHQHRLDGVRVQVAAFTNLTHDHLDYHGSIDKYLAAKLRLFTDIMMPGGAVVINKDGEYADVVETVCRDKGLDVISYGGGESDVCLKGYEIIPGGHKLEVAIAGKKIQVNLPLMGKFQVSNALAAATIAIACGENPEHVICQFEKLEAPPGRMELAGQAAQGALVFVDYAHTPDALSNVLSALRPHTEKRLHVVFGCGGERDSGKRTEMGALAHSLADVVIVTDDNPRTEDPAEIRAQVLARAPLAIEISKREEAIYEGVLGLDEGDILVIAGKGHETGQLIGTETRPFNDISVARDAIRRLSA
jgi:UDP-N-acetylmuramoyl-L-alanyl-D-glutamate--2,6-diaminopimelate ligase